MKKLVNVMLILLLSSTVLLGQNVIKEATTVEEVKKNAKLIEVKQEQVKHDRDTLMEYWDARIKEEKSKPKKDNK